MNKLQLLFVGLIFAVVLINPFSVNAQRRDFMTEQEADVVREAQDIDQRILVLTKFIDRRFVVLNNTPTDAKKLQKENELLGELPKSTRPELLLDINHLLQTAIDDVDDVAEHNRIDSKLFPTAMRKLTESSQSYIPFLKSALDKAETEKEKGVILGSLEFCSEIIEASAKVPKELPKDDKKDDKKKKKDDSN